MQSLLNHPLTVFVVAIVVLTLATWFGGTVLRSWRPLHQDAREDYSVVQAATLTLLGLIIGFSFSMAVNRYDQRKTYEEAEANAIGTEYVRAELLPPADSARVRALLKDYVEQRILFYVTRDPGQQQRVRLRTAQLQSDLWASVREPAIANPNQLTALAVAGMNDVLNAQGYTQAAWWNRIPIPAWGLMAAMAICANLLVGYNTRSFRSDLPLRLILPCVVSVSLFMIADIDSPRGGIIRVLPQNLMSLAETFRR